MVCMLRQRYLTRGQVSGAEPTVRLYNLKKDPKESTNLAVFNNPNNLTTEEKGYQDVINTIQHRLEEIRSRKPPNQKVSMQMLLSEWKNTFISGDCSMNPLITEEDCRFTHSWIDDVITPLIIHRLHYI